MRRGKNTRKMRNTRRRKRNTRRRNIGGGVLGEEILGIKGGTLGKEEY